MGAFDSSGGDLEAGGVFGRAEVSIGEKIATIPLTRVFSEEEGEVVFTGNGKAGEDEVSVRFYPYHRKESGREPFLMVKISAPQDVVYEEFFYRAYFKQEDPGILEVGIKIPVLGGGKIPLRIKIFF